jgi:hypothetical protein
MVAANILNEQSRTADNEWSSGLGAGRGAATTNFKNIACYEMPESATDLD